jgi:hypothetical protein
MPGAKSVPFNELLNADFTMKDAAALRARFAAAGADGNKPIVTSCGTGVTACILALGLKQAGPVTYGLLVSQIWSVAGSDARGDLSLGLAQPFLSYVTPDLVTYSAGADINYDWINDQATIPVNLGINKLIKGKQPLSIGGGVRYYVEKPAGGPDWGVRISVALLFPQ